MFPMTLSTGAKIFESSYLRHLSKRWATNPFMSTTCWILVFWASVFAAMAQKQLPASSYFKIPLMTSFASIGMALLMREYLGLGFPRQRLEIAHAPCSTIACVPDPSTAFISTSKPPLSRIMSLNFALSPAILPKPQTACSAIQGLFSLITCKKA